MVMINRKESNHHQYVGPVGSVMESPNFVASSLIDIMWPISQSRFYVSCLCSLK